MNDLLQQTLDALQGGVSNLDPSAGAQTVRLWNDIFAGSDVPGAPQLSADLEELQTRLEGGDLDSLGDLLAEIGQQTSAAAQNVTGDNAEGLQELARALSQIGRDLG